MLPPGFLKKKMLLIWHSPPVRNRQKITLSGADQFITGRITDSGCILAEWLYQIRTFGGKKICQTFGTIENDQKNWCHEMAKNNIVKNDCGQTIMSQSVLLDILGFQVRIHRFFLGDGDWYHSHPRSFISICIAGAYEEKFLKGSVILTRKVGVGSINFRRAETAHNVNLINLPCATLAITTPVTRAWEKFKLN